MKYKNIKIFMILIICVLLFAGCKPYYMLDEKGKIERILEKYDSLTNKKNFEEAFKLTTFIHQPKKKSEGMFKMAQKLLTSQYPEISYKVKDIKINKNIANVKVDMILISEMPVRRKTKIETQLFMYKPEKSIIWFIVSGNFNSRAIFLEKFSAELKGEFELLEDKSFIYIDENWIDVKNTKLEKGKLFILKDEKWIEHK
jgi:hypothetical protein